MPELLWLIEIAGGGDCGDKFDEKIYDCVHVSSLLCYITAGAEELSCLNSKNLEDLLRCSANRSKPCRCSWQLQHGLLVRYYATWPFLELIHEPLSSSQESWRAWPTEGLCLRLTVWHKHTLDTATECVCNKTKAASIRHNCGNRTQLRKNHAPHVCLLCFYAKMCAFFVLTPQSSERGHSLSQNELFTSLRHRFRSHDQAHLSVAP